MYKRNIAQLPKTLMLVMLGVCIGATLMLLKNRLDNRQAFDALKILTQKYAPIENIHKLLYEEYFDQQLLLSGQQKMLEAATKAYVNGIGDPYTLYLDNTAFSELQKELEGEGQIEGIGAVVEKKDYYIQIEEVIKGSPAFKAGLHPLDRIIMIGSGEVSGWSTSEAVAQIRGPKGTSVDLFIERIITNKPNEYLTITVTRDVIDIPSVKGSILTIGDKKLGHLEVSIFGDQTNTLMNKAISELLAEKVGGLILDLRGNGGGLLESAVDLAGHFLEPGSLVVKTKYRNYEDTDYKSKGFGELQQYPLVILIDRFSASASEILALALKDNLGARLIGEKTFGKGSIQTLQQFTDDSSLKYTIGKWISPRGVSIDKVGIQPDIEVIFDGTGYRDQGVDNQLEAAKSLLQDLLN